MPDFENLSDRFQGVLLGTAVGDALGLPTEGLSARRARLLFGGEIRHRFVFGRGMLSDDTEHSIFVAQCLLQQPDVPELFARQLARSLRWWLASLPAGVGLATLRSILKLWAGIPATHSGVASAGNGPAMRAAPIGARFFDIPEQIDSFTAASTRVTHSDERAEIGARAVAHLTALSISSTPTTPPQRDRIVDLLRELSPAHREWLDLVSALEEGWFLDLSVRDFARGIGASKGVSGYVFQTVPVAIYSWLRHFGDFRRSIESVLNCGGDTDTTGAIVGGLAGGVTGAKGIPGDWINGIVDWPRGTALLRTLGARLAEAPEPNAPAASVRYAWPGVLPRNALFLCLVLGHGLRRILPPY